jgi:hypothetical protein
MQNLDAFWVVCFKEFKKPIGRIGEGYVEGRETGCPRVDHLRWMDGTRCNDITAVTANIEFATVNPGPVSAILTARHTQIVVTTATRYCDHGCWKVEAVKA